MKFLPDIERRSRRRLVWDETLETSPGNSDPMLISAAAAETVEAVVDEQARRRRDVAAVRSIISDGSYHLVFQPIFDLQTPRCVAYEALCRFPDGRAPDTWFRKAGRAGVGVELELAVAREAIGSVVSLPEGVSISVNVSPATLSSGKLETVIQGFPHERIIIEITEETASIDDDGLSQQARLLQFRGVRIAIDDLGAGYSRLQHALQLSPDIIKLDRSLLSEISRRPAKRSLTSALVSFASDTGTEIVAEGIETEPDLDVLRALGVHLGQGWLLGRPVDLATASAQHSLLDHAGLAPSGAVGPPRTERWSPKSEQ